MARIFIHALGKLRNPPLWAQHHVRGDMDVASLTGIPRHSAGHEG